MISPSISYRYVINFLIVYGPFLGAYSDEGPASLEGIVWVRSSDLENKFKLWSFKLVVGSNLVRGFEVRDFWRVRSSVFPNLAEPVRSSSFIEVFERVQTSVLLEEPNLGSKFDLSSSKEVQTLLYLGSIKNYVPT